jgi:hypothetical protein
LALQGENRLLEKSGYRSLLTRLVDRSSVSVDSSLILRGSANA